MMFSKVKCPSCAEALPKDALFCGKCGVSLQEERNSEVKNNTWQAKEDEFAGRIKAKDLQGFFSSTQLVVAPGSQAYIFDKGTQAGIMKAGSYTLESMLSKFVHLGSSKNIEAIIFREAPLTLSMDFYELLSKDYLPLNFFLQFQVQITNPEMFISNYMGINKQTVTIRDIEKLLMPLTKQIVSETLGAYNIASISDTQTMRSKLSRILEEGMEKSLSRYGLDIVEIPSLIISQTEYDNNNKIVAQAWLESDRQKKELEAQQSFDSIQRQADMHEIENLKHAQQMIFLHRQLAYSDKENSYTQQLKEIDLLERVSKAETKEEAIRLNAADEIAQLEHQAKQRKQTRQEETIEWQYVRQQAQMQRDQQLQIMAERNQYEFEQVVAENRFREARQKRIAEIEIAKLNDSEVNRQLLTHLEQENIQAEHARQQRRQEFEDKLTEANQRFEAELAQRKASFAQQTQEDDAKHKRKMEVLAQFAQMNEAADQADDERYIKRKQQKHAHKIEEMNTLNTLNTEALISFLDREKGELIAGLKETELMQNLSEEQILAMMARNSPHVIEALKVRYEQQGAMNNNERDLYNRLIHQTQSELDTVRTEAQQQAQNLMKSQEIVSQTAVEMARALSGQPQAVASPQPMHQTTPQPTVERVQVCTNCRRENQADYRVCAYCGLDL